MKSTSSVVPGEHCPRKISRYREFTHTQLAFQAQWVIEDRVLPDYVRQEFEDYLKRGRLEHGFLRVRCNFCTTSNGRSGLI